jgi:DNA-damage-inducible protein D
MLGFEDFSQTNGTVFWYARDFMAMLGYQEWSTFRRGPLERAHKACFSLGIPLNENFTETTRLNAEGKEVSDFKLTRFACYLVAMNGDPKKPPVAEAQAYFAGLAENFRQYLAGTEEVERLLTRGELVEQEKSLSSTAHQHGVEQYAFFQNAGYVGMYNMNLRKVREIKRVPSNRSPLDFMGSTELAANLFRITQTDEKIRNEAIHGQVLLESAAKQVGRTVRSTMRALSGTLPENLPPAGDLQEVYRGLKGASREFRKMDKKSLPRGKQPLEKPPPH